MNKTMTFTLENFTSAPNLCSVIRTYSNEHENTDDSNNRIMHFHHSAELLLVEHGQLEVSSIDYTYILNSNDFVFINCDLLHRTKIVQQNTTVHMIQFEPFSLSSSISMHETLYYFAHQEKVDFYVANNFTDNSIYTAILEIISENHLKKISYHLVIKSNLLKILATLHRKEIIFNTFQDEAQRKAFEKLLPILDYVFLNYNTPISLDNLCVRFSISKSYFCKSFKLITGKTFCDFLTHMRIKHAIQLLGTPDKTITDIAYDCAFNSLSYFNKTFKKNTGYSPSEYRSLL